MKKILFTTLLGFCVGVTLLMITYLGVYYIIGQETFSSLILKLSDISIFQNQLLVAGFTGAMFSFVVHLSKETKETIVGNKISPTKFIVTIISMILSLVISMHLIKNLGIFDQVMVYALLIFEIAIIGFYSLFQCIQSAIDELIINKKLKENNK